MPSSHPMCSFLNCPNVQLGKLIMKLQILCKWHYFFEMAGDPNLHIVPLQPIKLLVWSPIDCNIIPISLFSHNLKSIYRRSIQPVLGSFCEMKPLTAAQHCNSSFPSVPNESKGSSLRNIIRVNFDTIFPVMLHNVLNWKRSQFVCKYCHVDWVWRFWQTGSGNNEWN